MDNRPEVFTRVLWVLCAGIAALGGYTLLRQVQVNPLRGDELFSFFHSDFPDVATVAGNVRRGADNTYVYNVLLWAVTRVLGHTMLVQRLLSLACWLLCGVVLLRMLRPYFDSPLWRMFTVLLVLFSAQGVFSATDGRMYALLLLAALLQAYLLFAAIHRQRYLQVWLTGVLVLAGLLVTPVFFAGQVLQFVALLVLGLLRKENYFRAQAFRLGLGAAAALVVFAVFFHVSYQHSSLLDGYLLHYLRSPEPGHVPGPEFWSIPFRWVLLPHVPGLPAVADGALLVGALALLGKATWGWWRQVPAGIQLVGCVAALGFLLLLFQLVLHIGLGIPLWSYRYYTPVFYFFPVLCGWLFYRYTQTRGSLLLPSLVMVVCLLRIGIQLAEVPQREQQLSHLEEYRAAIRANGCAVFAEQFTPDAYELGIYGELYIRYPELRGNMQYAASRGAEWAEWFSILDTLGYHTGIHDSSAVVVPPGCLILKRPGHPGTFKGHPTLGLHSPFAD